MKLTPHPLNLSYYYTCEFQVCLNLASCSKMLISGWGFSFASSSFHSLTPLSLLIGFLVYFTILYHPPNWQMTQLDCFKIPLKHQNYLCVLTSQTYLYFHYQTHRGTQDQCWTTETNSHDNPYLPLM